MKRKILVRKRKNSYLCRAIHHFKLGCSHPCHKNVIKCELMLRHIYFLSCIWARHRISQIKPYLHEFAPSKTVLHIDFCVCECIRYLILNIKHSNKWFVLETLKIRRHIVIYIQEPRPSSNSYVSYFISNRNKYRVGSVKLCIIFL